MATTPVDYYVPVEQIIKNYIGTKREEYSNEKEITIGELEQYYNKQYRTYRAKPSPGVPQQSVRPTRNLSEERVFKIKPFRYFIEYLKFNPSIKIIGKYDKQINNNQNITIKYNNNNDDYSDNLKDLFTKFIDDEKLEKLKQIKDIVSLSVSNEINEQKEIIETNYFDDKSRAELVYALGFAQNKEIRDKTSKTTTFENYRKNYEFHNLNDLKNLLIYTVLDDTDKVIDIPNRIATQKAQAKEKELDPTAVYQNIFIEMMEKVDEAYKETEKNPENPADITTIIESVIRKRFPTDQSVVDAIQNNKDTYAIIKIIKAGSLATGEISQAKLVEMFASAAGVDERQKANGRYFIAFLRYKGYTVKKDGDAIKFYKAPLSTNSTEVNAKSEFTNYRERYEFHSKEEVAPLVYLTITDIDGEIFPDIQARIDRINQENNLIAYSEKLENAKNMLNKILENMNLEYDRGKKIPVVYPDYADNFMEHHITINKVIEKTKEAINNIISIDDEEKIRVAINEAQYAANKEVELAVNNATSNRETAKVEGNKGNTTYSNNLLNLAKCLDEISKLAKDIPNALQAVITSKDEYDTVKKSKDTEYRNSVNRFLEVLKEFKRYIDKNGVTFTNQNMANTLPMINDFVNNLYPNYGQQQNIDSKPFYSSPPDFKADEALESVVTSIAPMRGPFALEVDKDRYAYEKLRAEARKIDSSRELKRRKLEEVARDLASLAMLVPDDASQKYVMDHYANSALNRGMLKIIDKLTPEQQKQKEREEKEEETERKHLMEIKEKERERERANIKRTAQEAENALNMAIKLGKEPEKEKETKETKQTKGGTPPYGEQERARDPRDPRDLTQDVPMEEAREAEEKQDEREVNEAEEEKKKPEEKEEKEEKEDDEEKGEEEKEQGEINEDIKRIQNYKKSKEKLDKIKTDIVNTENTVVRFKPYMDRYTIESPLTALDTANKDYEQTKLKITEIQKKKQEKEKQFMSKKENFDSFYKAYFKAVYSYDKNKDKLKKINTDSKSFNDLFNSYNEKFKDDEIYKNLISKIEEIINSNINEEDKLNQAKETIDNFLDSGEALLEFKTKIIKDGLKKLDKTIYGATNEEFEIFLRERYDTQVSRNYRDSPLSDDMFKTIIKEIPSYKDLIQQEATIKYEIEAKKNQASVVKTELQTAVDPVEIQDQAGLLDEAKKKTAENIEQIKKIIDNTHIPKFKSMWKASLKEITEGSSSIENLLQRLVDRTLKASKDIQTRLASIHGITSAPIEGTSSSTDYRKDREDDNEGNFNKFRELIGRGGNGESKENDTNDPQTIYRLLTEKLVKLKELVEQLLSFLERNTNTTALLSTNNEPSIFVQLYNKYVEDRADPKKSVLEATEGLVTSTKLNRVSPSDVLKIDKFDKTVFVGLTLFLRLFALTIMDYLIDKKKVNTIEGALLSYLVAYTAIFVLFVLIINLDMYRMRIIFNYINIHGGSMGILGHIIMLWLFAMLLFIILRNIRFLNNPSGESYQKAMTAEERSNLKGRMSVLSAAVWIFTTIMVVIS